MLAQWLPLLRKLPNFAFSESFVQSAKVAYDMYMYMLWKEKNCQLGPPGAVDLMYAFGTGLCACVILCVVVLLCCVFVCLCAL